MNPESPLQTGSVYDAIGATCAVGRRTEPRIAAQIAAALGDTETILNIGYWR